MGNADLNPDKALSHELSFRYNATNLDLEAAFFQRNSENLIDYVEILVGDSQWLASNIHDVTTIGGELNSSYFYIVGKQRQTFSFSYGYIHDDYTRTVNSRYALNSLKHNINVQLLNRLSPKWSTSFAYRYATRPLGGNFRVLNAQLEYVTNNFTIQLQGRNLFDATYYENLVPMPGVHGMVSILYAL